MVNKSKSLKFTPDFVELIKKHIKLDASGRIELNGTYASLVVNVMWKGRGLPIPYSHLVWFCTYKRWPHPGMNLDHINDNPLDNRIENLREISATENQRKRRGRIVYRNYGTGKYGFGMVVHRDKRDNRYYVTRNLSRGVSKQHVTKNHSLGGFDSLEEAEKRVSEVIELIKINGDGYLPPKLKATGKKKTTIKFDERTETMRGMRERGMTIQEIAHELNLKSGVVYRRIRDIEVDCRRPPNRLNKGSKLSREQAESIKFMRHEFGSTFSELAKQFGVSKTLIHQICTGKAWK